MTREMNKPDWDVKYWHKKWLEQQPKQRVLNPDMAEFVNELNKRLENK